MDTYLYEVIINCTRPVGRLPAVHATLSEICCISSDVVGTWTVNRTRVAQRSAWCFLLTIERTMYLLFLLKGKKKQSPLCQKCNKHMIQVLYSLSLYFSKGLQILLKQSLLFQRPQLLELDVQFSSTSLNDFRIFVFKHVNVFAPFAQVSKEWQ